MTNADKIRAMTDEGLAKYLCELYGGCAPDCPNYETCDVDCDGYYCDTAWLRWLKQEVDDDNK